LEQKREYILNLFNSAKDRKIEARSISIGKLTEDGKKYLSGVSGLDFRNFTDFRLNTSDLRHIYKDHYGENEKDKSNNIPLTENDIMEIIDVITNPDGISFLGYDKNKDANKFEFLKENKKGTYNLIEVYGKKGGTLTAKTFFNKKRGTTNEVLKSQGLPPLYARNVSGASPFGKVPQLIDINTEPLSCNKDTFFFETTKINFKKP
jgi:hypothetical protein